MKNMMCQEQIKALSEIVDGNAPFIQRMLFHAHLLVCSNCRTYYRQFKEMKETTQLLHVEEELPEDFFAIMDRSLEFSKAAKEQCQKKPIT